MKQDVVTLYAYDWNRAESYGRIALEVADGLEALGVYVNRIGPNAPQDKPIRMSMGGIGFGYPTQTDKFGSMFEAGPRVWVTAFESTALPYAWADIMNDAESIIVPSKWLVDVFKKEGVLAPVHCIPQGVSTAFKYIERKLNPDTPYTFLAFADRARRKGFEQACFGFMRAFGDDMNYRFIVKARADFPMRFTNPNVESVTGDLSDAEMAELYGRADCMIFPGREGYGLPPREFAATGGTSIALNWGGTADDLDRWGLPIATKGMESAWLNDPRLEGIGEWAVPDTDDLAATMKHVAAHRDYYLQRGKQAAAFIQETYGWATYARRVLAVWEAACESYGRSKRQAS